MAQLEEIVVEAHHQDPFAGKGKKVEIKEEKKINTGQLAEEISDKHGKPVSIVISEDPETKQKVLWIKPSNVDGRTINGALKSHKYNRDWGLTAEQVENRKRIERLKNGENLSLEEQNSILREILSSNDNGDA